MPDGRIRWKAKHIAANGEADRDQRPWPAGTRQAVMGIGTGLLNRRRS
jgi:hypothetical protein